MFIQLLEVNIQVRGESRTLSNIYDAVSSKNSQQITVINYLPQNPPS